MIGERKQKYLVPKSQIVFLKELGSNRSVFQEYGWKNTGTLFKSHLISYAIEFIREVTHEETGEDGVVYKKTYGVERIPDPMLVTEMLQYFPGLNVDRLVAFAALVAFANMQHANRGYVKRRERDKSLEVLDKPQKRRKLNTSPFRNIGKGKSKHTGRNKRNPFKNIG